MTTIALLMAGGAGSRMAKTLSQHNHNLCPKPLVKVREVELIERNLLMLLSQGFFCITVSIRSEASLLKNYIITRGRALAEVMGGQIELIEESTPLGTIGSVAYLAKYGQNVLIINADNLTAIDYRAMLQAHQRHDACATLAVHQEYYPIPHGEVCVEENWVRAYKEKPLYSVLISSAVTILSSEAIADVSQGQRLDLPELVTSLLQKNKKVLAFKHQAPWIDVNDADVLQRAHQLVSENESEFECWASKPDLQVVGVILRNEQDILLEKRSSQALCHPGLWDIPGGKIESDETAEQALQRELREELAITATSPISPVCVFDDIDFASRLIIRHHIFELAIDKLQVQPQQGMLVNWFAEKDLFELEQLNPVVRRAMAATITEL